MLHFTQSERPAPLLALSVCAFVLAVGSFLPPTGRAAPSQKRGRAASEAAGQADPAAKDEEAPPYHEYKGVRIGMTTDEARKLLGNPTDKGDKQDFYVFSDNETAQVFYDAEHKVFAVAVMYVVAGNNAPTPKSVVGTDIEPGPTGMLSKRVDYPKAGFWVAYNRTAGDSPIVSITMQKKQ